MIGGGRLVPAHVAEQSATEVTHTPDGRGTCVEVDVVGFSCFLTAFSPYNNANIIFDFFCQLAAGHRALCSLPMTQKLKCLNTNSMNRDSLYLLVVQITLEGRHASQS